MNSNMFLKRVCLIAVILAVAAAAPRRTARSTVPSWHLPCGEDFEVEVASSENLEEELRISLESLKLQHQLTMNDYLNRDYDYLYERVRIGVHDHQYIPNWVPDKKDVNLVRRLASADSQTIVNHFPKLHMDLQKFAVAFEELIEDEIWDTQVQQALRTTQSYLMMMLCEVESNILALPSLQLPTRVERSIMSSVERNPVDDTRRLVRDWGVLLKYRDYLHAWRHVFKY
ncbi:hypothetical protein DMN91_001645 [Ooceraea biroi]|uniref:Uncharacterized protein n=1 Tax=Ooceraea biroi TaxID=2015173 RepID=A0A3L8DZY9_OOCBI|nr:uncharacterized protein LOC113563615 [Ooceraea biroi]RLU25489.1 hypothetical protein DMN91_001645 [Ooceraea biroi]